MALTRRKVLAWLAGLLATPVVGQSVARQPSAVAPFAPVVPGYRIQFPRDEGSHPDFRVEWWYITGWLDPFTDQPLGFQITFFRVRPHLKHDNPSAFTPRQVIVAHAALSDPSLGSLIHSQRAARTGFALAGADEGRTKVWLDDWALEQSAGVYRARLSAREFRFDFTFAPTQPPLLQGEAGFSRKGPAPEAASYYYSLPHLEVSGTLARENKPRPVTGSAWLDHEWSSSYMAKEAVGWDWIGINLDDGGALLAFRMRDKNGGTFWAGGAHRRADGSTRIFSFSEVQFTPRREWRSARTGTSYPVSWIVRAGEREVVIEPLFDDQEQDTRASAGTIYWEGAAYALVDGRLAGRGYLELTGYWRPQSF